MSVNYSVKVLGQDELIGIPKLTMLVMSVGGKNKGSHDDIEVWGTCVQCWDVFKE